MCAKLYFGFVSELFKMCCECVLNRITNIERLYAKDILSGGHLLQILRPRLTTAVEYALIFLNVGPRPMILRLLE